MGKPTGFLEFARRLPAASARCRSASATGARSTSRFPRRGRAQQGARCMDCGIPFCHEGCPLGNLIPEWNDLVYRGDWSEALERLHATNNFPEFTGRLCPAPCEGACVLGINAEPVAIERIEYEIAERGWDEGWVKPRSARPRTGQVGGGGGVGARRSGRRPAAGRAGHDVVVYERAERPGGLLRYGIPEFKMEKAVLDRRLAQMEPRAWSFRCGTSVGAVDRRRRRRARAGGRGLATVGRRAADLVARLRRRGPGRWGHPAPRPAVPRAASSTASTGPWTT